MSTIFQYVSFFFFSLYHIIRLNLFIFSVVSKMKENEIDDEKIAEFKKKAPEAVKYLASNLKDFQVGYFLS